MTKFKFLKEWVSDPSWGSMQLTEEHYRLGLQYRDTRYVWTTKIELHSKFHAWTVPEAKRYCDTLIDGAKSKPHPIHKKDNQFRLYRILATILEGSRDEAGSKTGVNVKGNVESAEAGAVAMAACSNMTTGLPKLNGWKCAAGGGNDEEEGLRSRGSFILLPLWLCLPFSLALPLPLSLCLFLSRHLSSSLFLFRPLPPSFFLSRSLSLSLLSLSVSLSLALSLSLSLSFCLSF